MRLVLVAEEAAGVQVMRALGRTTHELVAVMASPERRASAGATMWDVATKAGFETWPAEGVRDPALAGTLRARGVDLVLNVYSLVVVNVAPLGTPRFGWYNLHPGRLPEYAGLDTASWAIYRGERVHGVTLHRMVAAVDAGPIAYEASFQIDPTDTALTLNAKCVRAGVPLVLRLVDTLTSDPSAVPAIAQDLSRRHAYPRRPPDEGAFSWEREAKGVVDFIRAFDYYPLPSPWGYPRTTLAGNVVGVIGASRTHRPARRPPGSIEEAPGGSLDVACLDEWVRVRRVQLNGSIVDAGRIHDIAHHTLEDIR